MAVAITYASTTNVDAGGNPSYTSQAIGTASSDRIVVVAVSARSAAATTTAVIIGGISASKIVERTSTDTTSAIWAAPVPTGTTATISVSWSGTVFWQGIAVWAMTGTAGNAAALNTSGAFDNSGTLTIDTTITIPANGGSIGNAVVAQTGNNSATWVGLTKNVDYFVSGENNSWTGASLTPASLQSGITVSSTWGGSADGDATLVVASWTQVPVLSGVSGTGTAGTNTPSIATGAVTGVVGTGTVGTAVATPGGQITGVAATGAVGTVTLTSGLPTVFGTGQVGTLTPSVLTGSIAGTVATGTVGTLASTSGPGLIGVFATGRVGTVYPIPPAPRHRPPLYIPPHDDYPPSIWDGT